MVLSPARKDFLLQQALVHAEKLSSGFPLKYSCTVSDSLNHSYLVSFLNLRFSPSQAASHLYCLQLLSMCIEGRKDLVQILH